MLTGVAVFGVLFAHASAKPPSKKNIAYQRPNKTRTKPEQNCSILRVMCQYVSICVNMCHYVSICVIIWWFIMGFVL
jgi:hypothetical protein